MAIRTTICVSKLVEKTNELLTQKHFNREAKEALCTYLEGILHSTGNYNGFYFTTPKDDPRETGPAVQDEDYYDRHYSLSRKLAKKRGFSH